MQTEILIVKARNSTEELERLVGERVAPYLKRGFSVRSAQTSGVCTSGSSTLAQVTYTSTVILDPPVKPCREVA